ncbi:MAG: hypothetical protein HQ478_08395 [Chloroflexi bacterium]|nr:hypothetical protein [Chloroflexota bacterium]
MTQTSSSELTRAILVGVGSSLGLYAIFIALYSVLGSVGIILAFIAPAAIGYVVGEAVYRSSGYTRNKNLAWVAAGSVFGGFAILSTLSLAPPVTVFGVLIGMYMAYTRVRP